MSVYYNVKEHLSIRNYQDEFVLSTVVDTLVNIANAMLYDRARINNLSLFVDGKSYSYAGSEIAHDFHEIIRAVSNQITNLEIVLDYSGVCYGFPIVESVTSAFENNTESADHIFYCLYNQADCESGIGVLSAFGKKNGNFYNGVVEPQLSTGLWDGEWESADTVIAFEEDVTDNIDLEQIKLCVTKLSNMNADIQFEINDTVALLYVNYVMLNSKEKIQSFVEICKTLDSATNGTCGFIAEFVDMSGDDVRTMIIDINDNEKVGIKISQIENI